ncbi:MAG: DUF1638 domain-containing protein [Lachnospiraceae bacterium]|nr:DUF1638 domain-containing protein [Lachnospiraceae bacterium]
MKFKVIACNVLGRELSYLKKRSENTLDISWFHMEMHEDARKLRKAIQQEIDRTEDSGTEYDAILLGYGLCASATAGLTTRSLPLVIPRAHDCITLCLGSKPRYEQLFEEIPGCLWYTANWINCTDMPTPETEARMIREFEEDDYDEEDIEYLMEQLGPRKKYRNAAYIEMPFFDQSRYHEIAKAAADFYGWGYHEIPGDLGLLERMLAGEWDAKEFLVLQPGETMEQSPDEEELMRVAEPDD